MSEKTPELPRLFTDAYDSEGQLMIHKDYPISVWEKATAAQETTLAYVNWVHDQEIEKNSSLKS